MKRFCFTRSAAASLALCIASAGQAATSAATSAATTAATDAAPPGSFNVFSDLPMFGIYVSEPPAYTPPPGVVLLNNGTRYATRLTAAQRASIGSDLKARVTYHAQCDNYDRLGSMFMVVKPAGVRPTEADPLIEIARWITPFSNYWNGAKATYVFPDADLSAFAGLMRNRKLDIWVGIDGGSNPYDGDPCTGRDVTPEFRAVGFRYSLDLVSTLPGSVGKGLPSLPVVYGDYTAVPVAGSAPSTRSGMGTAIVIVSGHGSANGGDEYKHTEDTLTVNGTVAGSFSTQVNCAAYRKYSPDGNPFIFIGNETNNPRNWCPGALVAARAFRVPLATQNSASLDMDDRSVPEGSYYRTSITLLPD